MARVSCPAPPAYCEAPRSASSDSRSLLGPAICRSGWSALIMTSALPGKLLLATFPWNPHDLRKRVPHFHRADVAGFPARDASQYQHHLPKAALSLPPATRRKTPRISLGAACSLCVPSARHGPPGKDAARWSRPGPKRSLFESGNLYCGERLKRCDAKEAPVPTLQEPEPKFWKATLMLGSMLWKTGMRGPWQPNLHMTTVVRSSSARITRQNRCRDQRTCRRLCRPRD
jgi:hypothetical protein